MTAHRSQDGYVLLVALVIMALAAVFAASATAAVTARRGIQRADAAHLRSQTLAWQALGDAAERFRWEPQNTAGSSSSASGAAIAVWRPSVAADQPAIDVTATGASSGSRCRIEATIELRPAACAAGLTVAADADLGAPVEVGGTGMYVGGCLRGREWLSFSEASDSVHGDAWPVAAAHALGSVWAAGVEIHDEASSQYDDDTDTHVEPGDIAAVTAAPDPVLLSELARHATPVGEALADDVLSLDLLPAQPPPSATSGSVADLVVVVVPRLATPVRVVGVRDTEDCRLILVLEGDAVLGAPGENVALSGALLACGTLVVAGPATVTGHLHARRLEVEASLSVVTPVDRDSHCLAGLSIARISRVALL